MSEFKLTLAEAERALLVRMLDTALGETRVEAHRTHFSPEFRQQVLDEENVLRGLLDRLRQAPA